MTPTATELWNDQGFIMKRIHEQLNYLEVLTVKYVRGQLANGERYDFLRDSARHQLFVFINQLITILVGSGAYDAIRLPAPPSILTYPFPQLDDKPCMQ